MRPPLARRVAAEFIGTTFLLIAVVGSGIAAETLSPGDIGLQLFESAVATAAALVALILALGPVSGAHLNPAVSLADRLAGGLTTKELLAFVGAQTGGGLVGTVVANVMFSRPVVEWSTKPRAGSGVLLGEVVATVGLVLVIFGVVRSGRAGAAPFAVGAYIGGAYFFTSSTSFANPAVTVARTVSNTFAGINPESVPAFVGCQIGGAVIAVALIRLLYPDIATASADVVMPAIAEETAP